MRVVRFMPFFAGNGVFEIVDEGERIAFDRPLTTLVFAGIALTALAIGAIVVHGVTHDHHNAGPVCPSVGADERTSVSNSASLSFRPNSFLRAV